VSNKRSTPRNAQPSAAGQSTPRARLHGAEGDPFDGLEAIFNLWYLTDDTGAVYSLRIHVYAVVGTEEEKRAFLRSRAELDYWVASAFPIPKDFHINIAESGQPAAAAEQRFSVAHMSELEPLGGPVILFRDAWNEFDQRLPAEWGLSVGARPLVCLTPLFFDGETLTPLTQRHERLKR
jgi:hypothetical protein